MGSGASAIADTNSKIDGLGCSDACKKFLKVFASLAAKDAKKGGPFSKLRNAAWSSLDANGNGLCSLAEVDGWILKTLRNDDDIQGLEADDIWKGFRPSYIRAFNDAKDMVAGKTKGKINTDDFVSKAEFRGLCAYLAL